MSTDPAGALGGVQALRALAAFVARADVERLPGEVTGKAKACLLYAMAVGIASMRAVQPAQAARAGGRGATGGATRFFDEARTDLVAAALANGTLFHARVQDDAHPAGHVGVVVIPAALAVAESVGASGRLLLAAIVAGYEAALRIGRDHVADASERGFRSTPLYGVFGAAAAAGRLLGLDAPAVVHALGLAANSAGGLREFAESGSEDFAFQAGIAAANGITAARLAAAGATAAASVLEGSAGFFRAHGKPGKAYSRRLAVDLGRTFEIAAVTYKPYPVCQFHRGIVRGCGELRKRAHGATPEALVVRMHPFEADFFGVRFAGPFASFSQTFMSAPFCAALAWCRGNATLAGLTDFAAADVLALLPRVGIVADGERPRYSPRIEARLADGTRLEWQDREGAESYLLTWEAARRMAQALGSEAGAAGADVARLVAAVRALDSRCSIDELVDAMRAACASAGRSG